MIIDGNSIVNRAFYGIRLLTNSAGEYTNAVYGFLNIMQKYMEEESPAYLCVAFDLAAPTFRHREYAAYKAQRKGMPEELASQMPVLKEVLAAMNVAMLSLEGYEADDIIGTVAKRCAGDGLECVILTGDKDDLQLASNTTRIKLVTTGAGGTRTTDYTDREVVERYGVTPEQFIDVKGLMGDPSDNIPGVAGIGEKTALELIGRFGSIQGIYDRLDDPLIKPGARKKLMEGRASAELSRRLATIDVNVPVAFEPGDCAVGAYDRAALLPLLRRLGFSGMIQKLGAEEEPEAEASPPVSHTAIGGIDDVREKARRAGTLYFYADPAGKTAVATCADDVTVLDVPVAALSDLLADPGVKKISHNIKEVLTAGIAVENAYFDVVVAAYLVAPARGAYDLAAIAGEHLGRETTAAPESALSSIVALHGYLEQKLAAFGQRALFFDVEMPLVTLLADIQRLGIAVDTAMLADLSDGLKIKIEGLTAAIYDQAGGEFNIASPKQLGEVLFERLRLPVIKKSKRGYSTDVEVLEKLRGAHEIIDYLMEYRQLTKLKSTYADALGAAVNPETGRIHSNFNQTGTVTGRLSSAEPNLQNIPVRTVLGREFRKVFRAGGDDLVLVDADYSQIELRVLAHIADDPVMLEAFRGGLDIHTQTASQVFGVPQELVTSEMRTRAKAVNFGIVYGIGDYSLSQDLNIPRHEAKRYIESYLETFGGVRRYMAEIVESGKRDGYVTTLLGRRRYLPELGADNFMTRSYGERMALNTPIQGTAADIIKIAMVRVRDRLRAEGLGARLVLQVHDELIVESPVPEAERVRVILREEMEGALSLRVPLKVDIHMGKTWYDAKG